MDIFHQHILCSIIYFVSLVELKIGEEINFRPNHCIGRTLIPSTDLISPAFRKLTPLSVLLPNHYEYFSPPFSPLPHTEFSSWLPYTTPLMFHSPHFSTVCDDVHSNLNKTAWPSQSYLDLPYTTVAWHHGRVYFQSYFEQSWSTICKVANSQWSGNLRDDHSSTLGILLWCNCQCISYHLSLQVHHSTTVPPSHFSTVREKSIPTPVTKFTAISKITFYIKAKTRAVAWNFWAN